MSKKADRLIVGLTRRLNAIKREIAEMEGNVDFLQKEAEPEAYRRWYLSHQSVRNLEGLVTESLERTQEYFIYKNLPWWKKLYKKMRLGL